MRVVVVRVRGLRPDFLGAYGNEWLPTPDLDEWAAGAVIFDRHFADATALRAVFGSENETPRSAWDLKRERKRLRALADDPPDFVDVTIDALLPPWDLPDGVRDKFFDVESVEEVADEDTDEDDDSDADEEVIAAVNDDDEEPLLPWDGPVPSLLDPADELTYERLQTTYAAAVAALDESLAKLLRDAGKIADVVVLTGDVGFALGEHGAVGLTPGPYEESLHLPLILKLTNTPISGRANAITTSSDLGKLVSLIALARGEMETLRDRIVTRFADWRSVRDDQWLLIRFDGQPGRLFAKPDDRWDQCDLRQPNPGAAEEREALLAAAE